MIAMREPSKLLLMSGGFFEELQRRKVYRVADVGHVVSRQRDAHGLLTWARVWLLTLQRNFSDALQVLRQFHGEILAGDSTAPNPKAFLEGLLYYYEGD